MAVIESASNLDAIREFYANFISGNVEKVARAVTTDFIMHVPGKGRNAGEYWGREGLRMFLRNILDYNAGAFSLQMRALAGHGDTVFTRELVTLNRRQDPLRRWALPFVMHYKMRNELVSEAWTIPEDLYLYDAYWGAASDDPPADAAPGSLITVASDAGTRAANNLELLQRLYQHFWDGEYDRIKPLYSPEFVFFAPGRGYLSGTYAGWGGYLEFRRKLTAISGGRYRLDVDAIAAGDRDVFAREFIRMNTTSHPAVRASYVVMHFEIEDGLIARANDFPVDLYDWERFFSQPAPTDRPS